MIKRHLTLAFMLLNPYTWLERDRYGKTRLGGLTGYCIENITESLNITLEWILETHEYGSRLPNGTYVGPQKLAHEGKWRVLKRVRGRKLCPTKHDYKAGALSRT